MTIKARFLSDDEERELFDRQQAEAMSRNNESMALIKLRRESCGLHVTENMIAGVAAISPAEGGNT